jgi:hypothetical protein
MVLMVLIICGFLLSSHLAVTEEKTEPAQVISPYMPDKFDFCGEPVPLQNYDIFESFERELIVNTYFHSQTLLYLKKAHRYFPTIEPLLRKHDIPEDFKYLVVAESGFSHVVSPAGAAGFWQLLAGTARDYGLEVNEEVDERYHLEKATLAACEYIQDSFDDYPNWTLVAASYNAGRRGIERQVERQNEKDYYDLLLYEETARYVFRILAIKAIMEQPLKYGFDIPKNERYKPVPHKVITVSDPIPDIAEFAQLHHTNYKLLKALNPWLRENFLTNKSGKEYRIKIPTTRELAYR